MNDCQKPSRSFWIVRVLSVACSFSIGEANVVPVHFQVPKNQSNCFSSGGGEAVDVSAPLVVALSPRPSDAMVSATK